MQRRLRPINILVCALSWFATAVAQEPTASSSRKELRTEWTFRYEGKSIDSLAVHDGIVVVCAESGALIALDARDGHRVWVQDFGVESSSVIGFPNEPANDIVLVTLKSSTESLVALDRKTGEFRWLRGLPGGLAGPVVIGNQLCGGSQDGKAYGINLKDGSIAWSTDFLADAPADPPGFDGKRARSSDHPARPRHATSKGNVCYFSVFDQCRALAFDAQAGRRIAAYPTRGWMFMTPVVTDKHVLVGSQDDHMYCFDKQTGDVVWKHKTKARVEAAACVDGDRVYWGSCDSNLYCLNRDTGEVIWVFATDRYPAKYGGPIYEPAVVTENTVLLPVMEGQVYAIDAQSGVLKNKYRPLPKSQIDGAAWDGTRLYVQTRKNFDNEGEEAVLAIGW